MRIEAERPRNAAGQRAGHDEVQRRQAWQFVAQHLAGHDCHEMCVHARGGDVFGKERVVAAIIGDDGDLRRVALVPGPGMGQFAQLHLTPPRS